MRLKHRQLKSLRLLGFDTLTNINKNNNGSYTFGGSCKGEEVEITYIITSEEEVDGRFIEFSQEGMSICRNGSWISSDINFSNVLENGTVKIEVILGDSKKDGYYNTVEIFKDTTPPVITIDEITKSINKVNQGEFELSGSCNESGKITVFENGVALGEGTCTAEEGWSVLADFTQVDEGVVMVAVNSTDENDNVSDDLIIAISKDITPPSLSLDAPLHINGSTEGSYIVNGDCSDNDQAVNIYLEIGITRVNPNSGSNNCSNNRWMATFDTFGFSDSAVNIVAIHMDDAGNGSEEIREAIRKDTEAPYPINSDIEVPQDDQYTEGFIDFFITFNEAVTVDASEGTPRIALDIGGNKRYASYIGSGLNSRLSFRHIIETGDSDEDGIAVYNNDNNIDLNMGVIKDEVGNILTSRAITVPSLSGITVQGMGVNIDQIVVDSSAGEDSYYKAYETVRLSVTFSESVTVNNSASLILNIGDDQDKLANYLDEGEGSSVTHIFTYAINPGENDSNGVSVTGVQNSENIVDINNNPVASSLSPAIVLGEMIVDTVDPDIVGLEDDPQPRSTKNWSWNCSLGEVSCTYQFLVNTQPSHTFVSGSFGDDTQTAQNSGDGLYYIHVQAKDKAGNTSGVVSRLVLMDNTNPELAGKEITVPGDDLYYVHDNLIFNVEFNDNVVVDETNGTPYLELDIGGNIEHADYFEGSGTNILIFRYIISLNDLDSDGIELNNNRIQLDSGGVRDVAGNDAIEADLMIPNLTGVTVNGVIPRVIGISAMAGSYRLGKTIALTVEFSKEVSIMGNAELVLSVGENTAIASYVAEDMSPLRTTHSFTHVVVDGHNDNDGIRLVGINNHTTINDSGNISVLANVSPAIEVTGVLVDTSIPEVTITNPGGISNEIASSYTVEGTCNENDIDVAVSVGALTPSPAPVCSNGSWSISNFDATNVAPGEITISAISTDTAGNVGRADSLTVTRIPPVTYHSLGRIAAGQNHSCAIVGGGEVRCWGSGVNGRTGYGFNGPRFTPKIVLEGSNALENAVQIDLGHRHTCALILDGTVRCWGSGENGRLGEDDTEDRWSAARVVNGQGSNDSLTNVAQIAAGYSHTCALMSDSSVQCWGDGSYGALGNNSSTERHYVDYVWSDSTGNNYLSGVVQVVSARHFSCALLHTGNVKCWGIGTKGQLGYGQNVSVGYPVFVVRNEAATQNLSNIIQISSKGRGVCSLNTEKKVQCWGKNEYGELGNNSNENKNYPVFVVSENNSSDHLSNIVSIKSGWDHSCVITESREVKCWGKGIRGQLGDDSFTTRNYPVDVVSHNTVSGNLSKVAQIGLGSGHSCAITIDGEAKCWGYGLNGRLGNASTISKDFPSNVFDAEEGSSAYGLVVSTYQKSNVCYKDGTQCSLDSINLSLSGNPINNTGTASVSFSGASSSGSLSIYRDESCQTLEGTTMGSSGSVTISNLLEGLYKFYFKIVPTSTGASDCSKDFISYEMDTTAPGIPVVTLQSASPGNNSSPVVRVSQVTEGDLISVHTDSICLTNALASLRATTDESFIDIATPLPSDGTYTFYTQATDSAGNESECSEVSDQYVLDSSLSE